ITSGIEGAWTPNPTQWNNDYFDNLLGYEWELTRSPAGAQQWRPKDGQGAPKVPAAHDPSVMEDLLMTTADMALKTDPAYLEISKRFHGDLDYFADQFARAWYKLTHRDMGPVSRYLGSEVPSEELLWQDPVPAADGSLLDDGDIASLKGKILDTGLSVSTLARIAWASAASFRNSDKRGGANGARIRLAPAKDWDVNEPALLSDVMSKFEAIKADFDATSGKTVSMADLIVLGGVAAVEKAAKEAGHAVSVPFTPGRTDASQDQTDVESYSHLELTADGFRNYMAPGHDRPAEELLLDKAQQLTLSAPEMTVLVAGMRAMGANHGDTAHGVLTNRVGQLTNDVLVTLLGPDTTWKPTSEANETFDGFDSATGSKTATATRVDLIFGSNSQLRAIAEAYAGADFGEKFVKDFVAAWDKVMMLDRFDVA
ncbi:MAG: peroxidase family protein, partial [Pseudomonadota bacterium]